jgi:succinoglycan biosynthesis transport protein ExoP
VQSAFEVANVFRHKTLIALITACFLFLGVIYVAGRPATYTASSQLLVFSKQLQNGPDTLITSAPADSSLVQNQIEIIQSPSILLKAAHVLNLKDDIELSSEVPSLSERVQTWLTQSIDLPPVFAKMLAALHSRGAAPIWATAKELKTERVLDSLRRKLTVKRVGSSQMVRIAFKHSDPTKAANIVNEITKASLGGINSITEGAPSGSMGLREHIKDLGPTARIVSAATPPIRRDGPTGSLIVVAATVLGLGLGAGIAFLKVATDRTIRTPGQAISLIGVDCLGLIPRIRKGFLARLKDSTPPTFTLVSRVQERPHSILFHAIRRVSAATLELSDQRMRSVGVTAAIPGEGATTIARNLALIAASAGRKILLVDGVSSDPRLSRLLAPGDRTGLTEVVNGGASLTSSILTDERSGLQFLPFGEPSACNVDRMWYAPMDDFLGKTSELYDLVIIDLPPLACAADARLAARVLDAFLLVIAWGETEAPVIQEALRQSGQVGSKIVGTVLNKVDMRRVDKCHRIAVRNSAVHPWMRANQEIRFSASGSAEKPVSAFLRPSVNRREPKAASNLKRVSS